jgi:glycosyltransferase involved in cell wall biosynthesis
MRVAFFTPVSPQKTGIADYSEQEMLPHLSRFCDIDIFIDKNVTPSNKNLIKDFNIYPYSDFPALETNYDIPIYQMGNNLLHKFVYDTLIQYPGIVVLHDIFLHGFLWNVSLAQGDANKYIDTFEYCYGKKGAKIAQIAVSTGVFPEFEYPLIKKIIDKSLGVVSHSNYGIKLIMEENRDSITKKINQPYTIPDPGRAVDHQQIKSVLDLSGFYPIISSFGFIFSHKRYNIILKAFRRFLAFYPNAMLVLVGEDMMDLRKRISDLGLEKSVFISGYMPHNKVQQYLDVSDFCINLRYPTAGETSRSVLQIMASQKPVIVSDVGWFSELPDNACLKVCIDNSEEEILLQYMIALTSNEGLKNTIGKNAQNFVIKDHDPEKISHDFFSFLKNCVDCDECIVNTISRGLSELGISENESLLFKPTVGRLKEIF